MPPKKRKLPPIIDLTSPSPPPLSPATRHLQSEENDKLFQDELSLELTVIERWDRLAESRKFEVKDSSIDGKGVFALQDIEQNSIVLEMYGLRASFDKISKTCKHNGIDTKTCLGCIDNKSFIREDFPSHIEDYIVHVIDDGIYLVECEKYCIAARINGSCQFIPNVVMAEFTCPRTKKTRLFLIAQFNIFKGQELFVDYSADYWKSKNCVAYNEREHLARIFTHYIFEEFKKTTRKLVVATEQSFFEAKTKGQEKYKHMKETLARKQGKVISYVVDSNNNLCYLVAKWAMNTNHNTLPSGGVLGFLGYDVGSDVKALQYRKVDPAGYILLTLQIEVPKTGQKERKVLFKDGFKHPAFMTDSELQDFKIILLKVIGGSPKDYELQVLTLAQKTKTENKQIVNCDCVIPLEKLSYVSLTCGHKTCANCLRPTFKYWLDVNPTCAMGCSEMLVTCKMCKKNVAINWKDKREILGKHRDIAARINIKCLFCSQNLPEQVYYVIKHFYFECDKSTLCTKCHSDVLLADIGEHHIRCFDRQI